MGVDWRLLDRYKSSELNDDRVELLYNQISAVDAQTESDVKNLQLLVSVAQRVLQVKAVQAEEAKEMVEKMPNKSDVERLKKENELLKQALSSDEVTTSSRLQDYEEQLSDLKRLVTQKEVELSKSKRKSDEVVRKLLASEKENELLKSENESMKEDLDQRLELDDHLQESQQSSEKLREKNRQVQKLLDELKSLESVNEELSQKVTELNHELKEATYELNRSADEMKQLQSSFVSTHEMNQTLLKEKEFLMKEKMDLESESHAAAIRCKDCIDSMVKLLAVKDVEINELRELKSAMRPSSSTFQMTGTFDSGKELELNQVKSKLQEATNQLETQNKMVEELQNELHEVKQFVSKKVPLGRQQHPDSFSNPIYDAKIHELNASVQQLEEELKSKDQELNQVKERNKLYESGKYGLSDALNELKIEHNKLISKENQVEELVKELNELKLEMDDTQDELDYIKECARLKGIDPTYDPKSSISGQNDKMKIFKLQEEVVALEDRNIKLQDELRKLSSKLKHPSTGETTKDDSMEVNQSTETVHYLSEKLNEVQEENSQLILGMREVLNALRVSDSKSDVVVECPTLERILIHFESRCVTSEQELANLITLKSELDLVRGQNEQLRSEMKVLRNERRNLLSYCTQHIMNENKSSNEESNITPDEDLDMSEGEVFPSAPLNEPQVDQDTAAGKNDDGDDVIITREEILGRGIKLVISEVLNEPNEDEEDDSERNAIEPRMSDISTESQHESGQEIKEDEETVIKTEKVPCTKCPKAFAALEEVLKRVNKIISIIKQREQDKKSPTTIVQETTSSSSS